MDTTLRILSAAVSDRGLSEKRPQNEDSFLELADHGIFAVADGVGGAQAGEVASQMAMEILADAFQNIAPNADAEAVMRSAIEGANSAIYRMAQDLPQLASMATTVVALHLRGNIATIGHVGDSRLYRVSRDGEFYRETDDHSMVADEVRAGRMTEEQAETHPSRNIISRALGAEPTVAVDLKTIMIEPGTVFLACSDGITRHVTDQEIKGVLTFGGSPDDVCSYLKDLCFDRGAEDNLTAVVIKTSGVGAVVQNTWAGNPSEPADEPDEKGSDLMDVPTLASPRNANEIQVDNNDYDDDLLELDPERHDPPETAPIEADVNTSISPAEPEVTKIDVEPAAAVPAVSESDFQRSSSAEFSMFGNSGEAERPDSSTASKALSALAFTLIGALLGIGIYYFVVAPKPVDTDGPQLSEMRSANISLSAFEDNRRNVDRDPANYVAKFGSSPQDAEDFYLLGRAYVLTGDYQNARASLVVARNRLAEADPSNARVLASDIALALAVTNDTTIQSILRKELDFASSGQNASAANTVPSQ